MIDSQKRQRDWGESGALFVCTVLFFGLRDRYTLGPPVMTLVIGSLIAATFLFSVYWTIVGNQRAMRIVMTLGAFILGVGVGMCAYEIVYLVIYHAAKIDGIRLIQTALLIWVGNVVVFAIIYHWIGEREFAFPRPDPATLQQPLCFLDYIFLSFTTATAFSPTDTAPLSTRVRMFMMIESVISLATIAIAAARAINVLPQSG